MATEQNNLLVGKRVQKKIKLVPPDGGWGWMVIIGTALSNIFNQSMLSLFGLLYGDVLDAMGQDTKGAAVVLSTMLFVTNFGGPVAGVILNLTSPRFVAVVGACFCTSGIFLSGFATSLWHLIISYGVLLGTGLGFIQNSSFVAINSYFKLKKSRAVGLANVGTGVGQSLMPHLVRYLLHSYGYRGACLLLSSLSLHGIAGTLLIEPVERHLKKIEEEIIVDEQMYLLNGEDNLRKNNINEEKLKNVSDPFLSSSNKKINGEKTAPIENGNSKIETKKSLLMKIYELLDISLLSSPRFLNIIIGTALSVTSIQNFSMIFPFFLQKVALLDKHQTAMCMSAIAGADITGRLILPVFQDKYKIKARWMIIVTCIWLIITRQILAYQTGYKTLILMAALYGFGRSMVIVARNLSISEQCHIDKVPAAVGLGMLTMGIIVPPAGYFLGWIRDYTGSYITCITAQNVLLLILLATWVPDMILLWIQEKKQKKEIENIPMK